MSVRPTSIEAWESLQTQLTELMLKAFRALWNAQPKGLTGKEVDAIYGSDTYHKRMSELKDWGVATDLAEGAAPGSDPVTRRCTASKTNEMAVEWRVTGDLPRSRTEYEAAKEARIERERIANGLQPSQKARMRAVVAALRRYTTGDRCSCVAQTVMQVPGFGKSTPHEPCRFCAATQAIRHMEG
jgi:hypothetical protein